MFLHFDQNFLFHFLRHSSPRDALWTLQLSNIAFYGEDAGVAKAKTIASILVEDVDAVVHTNWHPGNWVR